MRSCANACVCLLLMGHGALAQESDVKELVAKARALAEAKDFEAAIVFMKKASAREPRNDLYLAITSDYELKAGKFADGLAHALQAIDLNDREGGYFIVAATNAYWTQDLERARAFCARVLKKGPQAYGLRSCQEAQYLHDLTEKHQYTLFWNLDPKKGHTVNGALSITVPRNGLPYQTVSFEIEGDRSHRFIKGEVNDVLSVVPQGTKPFSLTITVTTQPYSYKKEIARAVQKEPSADARAFLGAFLTVDPKSPTLKKALAGLKGDDGLTTVRNILAWMKKNIDYKLQQSETIVEHDFKNVDEIVKRGHAECRGYALLFTGLCRASGIPARPVWGLFRMPPGAERKYGDLVSHNWAEFYISGCGWVPVDPQRAETLGFMPTNYLRFAVDSQKSQTSVETVPMRNLMFMHGGKLKFEESRSVVE